MLSAYRLYAFSIVSLKRSRIAIRQKRELACGREATMQMISQIRERLTWSIEVIDFDRHKSCHVGNRKPAIHCELHTCPLVIDLRWGDRMLAKSARIKRGS